MPPSALTLYETDRHRLRPAWYGTELIRVPKLLRTKAKTIAENEERVRQGREPKNVQQRFKQRGKRGQHQGFLLTQYVLWEGRNDVGEYSGKQPAFSPLVFVKDGLQKDIVEKSDDPEVDEMHMVNAVGDTILNNPHLLRLLSPSVNYSELRCELFALYLEVELSRINRYFGIDAPDPDVPPPFDKILPLLVRRLTAEADPANVSPAAAARVPRLSLPGLKRDHLPQPPWPADDDEHPALADVTNSPKNRTAEDSSAAAAAVGAAGLKPPPQGNSVAAAAVVFPPSDDRAARPSDDTPKSPPPLRRPAVTPATTTSDVPPNQPSPPAVCGDLSDGAKHHILLQATANLVATAQAHEKRLDQNEQGLKDLVQATSKLATTAQAHEKRLDQNEQGLKDLRAETQQGLAENQQGLAETQQELAETQQELEALRARLDASEQEQHRKITLGLGMARANRRKLRDLQEEPVPIDRQLLKSENRLPDSPPRLSEEEEQAHRKQAVDNYERDFAAPPPGKKRKVTEFSESRTVLHFGPNPQPDPDHENLVTRHLGNEVDCTVEPMDVSAVRTKKYELPELPKQCPNTKFDNLIAAGWDRKTAIKEAQSIDDSFAAWLGCEFEARDKDGLADTWIAPRWRKGINDIIKDSLDGDGDRCRPDRWHLSTVLSAENIQLAPEGVSKDDLHFEMKYKKRFKVTKLSCLKDARRILKKAERDLKMLELRQDLGKQLESLHKVEEQEQRLFEEESDDEDSSTGSESAADEAEGSPTGISGITAMLYKAIFRRS